MRYNPIKKNENPNLLAALVIVICWQWLYNKLQDEIDEI